MVALAAPGLVRGAPVALPPPPTSPTSAFGPGFPQPPTPAGRLPITTYRWPFEVLPYYDALPRQDTSPYAHYLLSPPSAQATFRPPLYEPFYVPAYTPPQYQILPGQPLY